MNHQPEYRGENITTGKDVTFGTGVVLYEGVQLGNGVVIEDHCVIGRPFGDSDSLTILADGVHVRSHSVIYQGAELGEGTSTGHHVTIREKSMIGKGCNIGSYSDLQGDLTVGNYCRLHSDVHLCKDAELADFVFIYPRVTFTNDPYPPSEEISGPSIGEFSQICTGSIIFPGVEVGKNCLIGAGSLVTKNVPDYSLAYGHPAVVKDRVVDLSPDGKPHYPWVYRYDKHMPWEGIGYDQWKADLDP